MSDTSASKRTKRRGVMIITGLVASILVFAIGGQVALAHNPVLDAQVSCSRVVTWTASAWVPSSPEDDHRVNNDVKVWYQLNLATPPVELAEGAFNAGNNYQFSGKFDFPAEDPNEFILFAREQVGWGPNEDLSGPSGGTAILVARPPTCPSVPSTSIKADCVDGNGTVTVTLAVTGPQPVDFSVSPPGGPATTYTVQPGSPQDVTFANIADTPAFKVTITAGDQDLSQTIAVNCDRPGAPSADVKAECAGPDGTVNISLTNTGGQLPIDFTVTLPGGAPTVYTVAAGTTMTLPPITGVADTPAFKVTITALDQDLSQTVVIACDHPGTPSADVKAVCANFDGTVTVTLTNTGGQLPIDFSVTLPGGAPTVYSVAPGTTMTLPPITGVADTPTYKVTITALGQDLSKTVSVNCDSHVNITAICSEQTPDHETTSYWFTITNTGQTPLSFTLDDGTPVNLAGGQSANIKSVNNGAVHLDGGTVRLTAADVAACTRTVIFDKELIGQPPTGETYTIRVSCLVGESYQEEVTFDINAGIPKTFELPSTFDPAGITYKVEEISTGTSVTHAVSPDSFTLTGNLGETVDVVITNGYAAVQIDKTVSATKINAGDNLTYTLVAKNTGGLTLDPVVITDLFPPQESVVSASVANGGGDCTVVRTTRPQLLRCTMTAALAPNGLTPAITIVVKTDDDTPNNANLLNQARVLGTYVTADGAPQTDSAQPRPEVDETSLSCLPVVAGTVCDLSAKVGTLAEGGTSDEPPTVPTTQPPVTTPPSTGSLPVTGASGLGNLLAIAFVFVSAGVVLVRRRRPSAG